MATIFLLLIAGLALRRRSFLQIDELARLEEMRRWMGAKRYLVASDSTCERLLPEMDRGQLREEAQQAYRLLRQSGHDRIPLPSGRRLRAAAVDGTVLSGRRASCVQILGDHATMLDLQPYRGRGKELPASQALLRRIFRRHGRGFMDVVLGDGLYMTAGMFRLCQEELGAHLLVKTKELSSLLILQEAEEIFRASAEAVGELERAEGIDEERKLAYQVWAARGFHHTGFEGELKVARVRIEHLKGKHKGKVETFWVLTSDLTLSAEDMRELAHLRWSIENHGFRALNDMMSSKHVWARGRKADEAFEALMLIMFLAMTLVLAYQASLNPEQIWQSRRLRRLSVADLATQWMVSLHEAAGLFSADGG